MMQSVGILAANLRFLKRQVSSAVGLPLEPALISLVC